jgi:hypothetical protein
MLKSGVLTKEIGGQQLLMPNLLAFFDCCVAVAHYAQNIMMMVEAEKRTPHSLSSAQSSLLSMSIPRPRRIGIVP